MWQIDEAIEKYLVSMGDLYSFQKKDIIAGLTSFLKTKYHIDFDNATKLYAFRSEYNFDLRVCDYQKKLKQEANRIFYELVRCGEIDYQDIQTYVEILGKLVNNDVVCKECMSQSCGYCKVQTRNDELHEIQSKRKKASFKGTTDIAEFHNFFMSEVSSAVNKRLSIFRSYSKCLAAPMFKYSNQDNCIYITLLSTNTTEVQIEASYFDWFDTYDEKGEENNRYHSEFYLDEIPIKELVSKDKLLEVIRSQKSYTEMDDYMDTDNVELTITGISIDISEVSRNNFDRYFWDNQEISFKRMASYRKDLEILTTKDIPDFRIKNFNTLQLIRYIYLLKIGSAWTDKTFSLINDIYIGKHRTVIDISEDNVGFVFVWEYLCDTKKVEKEKEQYFNLFKFDSPYYFHSRYSGGVFELFNKIVQNLNPNKYNKIFDKDLLKWLIDNSK